MVVHGVLVLRIRKSSYALIYAVFLALNKPILSMQRDQQIFDLIAKEQHRQESGIELIASENFVSEQVMAKSFPFSFTLPRFPLDPHKVTSKECL